MSDLRTSDDAMLKHLAAVEVLSSIYRLRRMAGLHWPMFSHDGLNSCLAFVDACFWEEYALWRAVRPASKR
jgi:hypothetical protein